MHLAFHFQVRRDLLQDAPGLAHLGGAFRLPQLRFHDREFLLEAHFLLHLLAFHFELGLLVRHFLLQLDFFKLHLAIFDGRL